MHRLSSLAVSSALIGTVAGMLLINGVSPAEATPVTVELVAILADGAPPGFQLGETVLLSYTFETDTSEDASTLADPDTGEYNGGLLEVSATFQSSGQQVAFGGGVSGDQVFVCNDNCLNVPAHTDALQFFSFTLISADPIEGSLPMFMSLLFNQQRTPPTLPTMVSDDNVPTAPFAFDFAALNITTADTGWGLLLLPVPEPGTSVLTLTGLLGLAMRRNRLS